jgi:hypothetical protein
MLLTVSAAGVYFCVPDTERAVVVLGVAVAIGLIGWPGNFAAAGRGGAAAFTGLIGWLAATDGAGRHGAVVGAAACVGVIVLVPALRLVGARGSTRLHPPIGSPAVTVVVVQIIVVALCSRVAGLQESAAVAAFIAVFTMAAAVVALRPLFRAEGACDVTD